MESHIAFQSANEVPSCLPMQSRNRSNPAKSPRLPPAKANLDYSLGWLRRVIGVAETHRWHHKRDFEDAQVNFGEFLLVWDQLLGTYYDSVSKPGSAEVGLHDRNYPTGYVGQLVEPFRSQ
ncbi:MULTISPECIES: sterol desaturase family protein [Pseudomonadaceae]|uniref:Fatty acid hydroxylase domain-containing protein n=1 Tax=Metapseudomonas otitidis TaxID=319939 RepID=A0ABU3XJS5_9GAMM|nr:MULTISPECIES: hypothetical protein [Pseudomonas]MDU9399389.1 hypothetical protein [Pseudomonas sp. zfem003]MDV3438191.1 hypothetical protein [Pseudomonas otitidis]